MNPTVQRAQEFIWTNARLLERQLFAHVFAGGAREPVLAALRAYQNADGGFGNALEPDKRDPHSQPVDVQIAFELLDPIDAFADPLVAPACIFRPMLLIPLPTKSPGSMTWRASALGLTKVALPLLPFSSAMLMSAGPASPLIRAMSACPNTASGLATVMPCD